MSLNSDLSSFIQYLNIFIVRQIIKQIEFQNRQQNLTFKKSNTMFNFIRRLSGGPKNRIVEGDYDLDLTYITNNIIAMAFPGQGLQQIYRNCLQDVSKYLQLKHGSNYLIINVSNRRYSYEKFSGKIIDFYWPNHQTPCLQTLFNICQESIQFLKKNLNLEEDIYFSFSTVRKNQLIKSDFNIWESKNNEEVTILIGNIYMEVYQISWLTGKKVLGQINFNTYLDFCQKKEEGYAFQFKGQDIKIKSKFKKAIFKINMKPHFCKKIQNKTCACQNVSDQLKNTVKPQRELQDQEIILNKVNIQRIICFFRINFMYLVD